MRSVCIITTWQRPALVIDAIESVREQTDPDVRLIVMDDCSDVAVQSKIIRAMRRLWSQSLEIESGVAGGSVFDFGTHATLWLGPERSLEERKRTISYSNRINVALNYLLRDERFICYLPDDDYLHFDAIKVRADYLDANPDVHVCFGRQRSVQYGADGSFNQWQSSGKPQPGRACPVPTGRREHINNGASALVYFENGERDPQTGLDYVEEGFWELGPQWYGKPFCTDHSQILHRASCLTDCQIPWYGTADAGGVQYWGEDMAHGVGDKSFFEMLGSVHPLVGVDVWTHTKRFANTSDGVQFGPVRE